MINEAMKPGLDDPMDVKDQPVGFKASTFGLHNESSGSSPEQNENINTPKLLFHVSGWDEMMRLK